MKMISGTRALDKIYKRRNRYEIPEWQRGEVWPTSKKQNLIDTILKGWKLPKFYFIKTNSDPETFEVVDGQQRLAAIFEFFDNELALSPITKDIFGAEYYKDLEDQYSDKFDDFEIQYDLIEECSDEDVKEFFQRLQEGMQLTSSEKLNSIHSNVRNFAYEITSHSFLKDKINVTDKRYGHFDIACKIVAIEIDGLDASIRFDDIKNIFENYAKYPNDSKQFSKIRDSLDFLNELIKNRNPKLQSRSIVQSFITLTSKINIQLAKKESTLMERYQLFLEAFLNKLDEQIELGHQSTDYDYIDFQRTISANTRNGVKIRHDILIRKMIEYEPELYKLLSTDQIFESGIKLQSGKIADNIQKQIKRINDQYSATYGKDLFKMTNRSVPALQNIGINIDDADKVKTFIEDLYFIFRESIGQRLKNHLPTSFSDINLIRTGMEHDVDHGDAKEIEKKKILIAKTIEKYSTKKTIEEFDVATYCLFQVNILNALRDDLYLIKISDLGKE